MYLTTPGPGDWDCWIQISRATSTTAATAGTTDVATAVLLLAEDTAAMIAMIPTEVKKRKTIIKVHTHNNN